MENAQPEPVSEAKVPVAIKPVLQLSVTVAPPKAAAICPAVGLQPKAVEAASVIVGFSVSGLVRIVMTFVVLQPVALSVTTIV